MYHSIMTEIYTSARWVLYLSQICNIADMLTVTVRLQWWAHKLPQSTSMNLNKFIVTGFNNWSIESLLAVSCGLFFFAFFVIYIPQQLNSLSYSIPCFPCYCCHCSHSHFHYHLSIDTSLCVSLLTVLACPLIYLLCRSFFCQTF